MTFDETLDIVNKGTKCARFRRPKWATDIYVAWMVNQHNRDHVNPEINHEDFMADDWQEVVEMNIPTKRFAVSIIITDKDLLEYQGQGQSIKEHIKHELLQRVQTTILPEYPSYVIIDPYFEADRDIQHCWTTVTFSFRLEKRKTR